MGSLAFEPYASFVRYLVEVERYSALVETGTYMGETTLWASQLFSHVYTIEISKEFQDKAKIHCSKQNNITFFLGRTEERLSDVLRDVKDRAIDRAIFWLDAHAGGGWYADKDDCPLLAELCLLSTQHRADDIIIIDDARGFLAPPPPPFDPMIWPPIHAVLDAADPRRERYVVIIADMIICAPFRLRNVITEFCNKARPTI